MSLIDTRHLRDDSPEHVLARLYEERDELQECLETDIFDNWSDEQRDRLDRSIEARERVGGMVLGEVAEEIFEDDGGFSFEVNIPGGQQMWFSVLYIPEQDMFKITCGSQSFRSTADTSKPGQFSNSVRAEQSFLIDRNKAHILLNPGFWHNIGDWAERMNKKFDLHYRKYDE